MTEPSEQLIDEAALSKYAMERLTEDMHPDQVWRSDGERLLWQAEQEGREIPSEAGSRQ